MESKEYIKGVLYNLEKGLDIAKENKNKDLEFDYKMQKEAFTQVLKDLNELEELKKVMGTPIQTLMRDLKELEKYRNEKYKHWNIFFNAKKLEYLLYLEQKGKESFMTSISEELYSKIHKHFIE